MSRIQPRAPGAVRAGLLSCICDGFSGLPANDNYFRPANVFELAAGFAFAVLGQTVASAALPLAGLMLAPHEAMATWPFAALMLGATLASFPAAFLRDAFGRRAGFALGASLGLAGALMLAMGLLHRQFAFTCIGGLWLGMAQGFSFFYRHEAAAASARPGVASAGVLAGGLLAALAGPLLARGAEALLAPYFLVGAALVAASAHLLALTVAVRLAPDPLSTTAPQAAAPLRGVIMPSLAAGLAWGCMSLLMGGSPIKLVDCGISEGATFGFIALHVFAMYAPAVPLLWLARTLPAPALAACGVGLAVVAVALAFVSRDPAVLALALVISGGGWCMATVGSTAWLRMRGAPGRLALALHDFTLFGSALLGVQAAAFL